MAEAGPGAALDVVRSARLLRDRVAAWRATGHGVGLVPTMGGIHDGHLALIEAARAACRRVVVSLFVNPRQFGAGEDLASYPADEGRDALRIAGVGADLLFAPGIDEMYPEDFATTVAVSGLTDDLCGAHRPGHFAGVTTVVTKLFNQCEPDAAWFGEKDYQQLVVIRRLAADLALPVEIHAVPTVREPDGLALSSRNAYLSAAERRVAPALHRTLAGIAGRLAGGADADAETAGGRAGLAAAGFDAVEYLELRDAGTLRPLRAADRPARLLAAARLGRARLIDNVPVAPARRQGRKSARSTSS